jgi:hypothetical protein
MTMSTGERWVSWRFWKNIIAANGCMDHLDAEPEKALGPAFLFAHEESSSDCAKISASGTLSLYSIISRLHQQEVIGDGAAEGLSLRSTNGLGCRLCGVVPSVFRRRRSSLHPKRQGEDCMKLKSSILAAALAVFVVAPAAASRAQTAGQDMKNAGHDTADASRQIGHKTERGTRTAAHDTAHGTKVATHKTVEGTRTAAHGTEHGTSVAAHKTAEGSRTAAHDTAHGATVATHKTENAGRTVGRDTVHGTKEATHKIDGKPESESNPPR